MSTADDGNHEAFPNPQAKNYYAKNLLSDAAMFGIWYVVPVFACFNFPLGFKRLERWHWSLEYCWGKWSTGIHLHLSGKSYGNLSQPILIPVTDEALDRSWLVWGRLCITRNGDSHLDLWRWRLTRTKTNPKQLFQATKPKRWAEHRYARFQKTFNQFPLVVHKNSWRHDYFGSRSSRLTSTERTQMRQVVIFAVCKVNECSPICYPKRCSGIGVDVW